MPIKIKEITKGDSVNAVGNIVFAYDVVDEKGTVLASETSTMSVNYNSADMKEIASCLLKDAESKEYDAMQKSKADKFDIVELKTEIEKQITTLDKAVIG